jgi:ribosomal protein L31
MENKLECPFCEDKPCNQPHCPYTRAKNLVRSHIWSENHAFYSDRIRIIDHIQEMQDAYINSKQ